MFGDREISDFKAEIVTERDLDLLRVSVEVAPGIDRVDARQRVSNAIKATFEVSPEIVVLESGTLATEFESSVKAPGFADRRA